MVTGGLVICEVGEEGGWEGDVEVSSCSSNSTSDMSSLKREQYTAHNNLRTCIIYTQLYTQILLYVHVHVHPYMYLYVYINRKCMGGRMLLRE